MKFPPAKIGVLASTFEYTSPPLTHRTFFAQVYRGNLNYFLPEMVIVGSEILHGVSSHKSLGKHGGTPTKSVRYLKLTVELVVKVDLMLISG